MKIPANYFLMWQMSIICRVIEHWRGYLGNWWFFTDIEHQKNTEKLFNVDLRKTNTKPIIRQQLRNSFHFIFNTMKSYISLLIQK